MAIDATPNARPTADALTDEELSHDIERISSSLVNRTAETQHLAHELRTAFGHISSLVAKHEEHGERLSGLEEAARAAIDLVTADAERRLAAAIERAENRVVETLTLSEQHQQELNRWRADIEGEIRNHLRDLGDWDDALNETRREVAGLHEMAEAALSLASGDLDRRWEGLNSDLERRWDALGRELREVLATAESDERARWEAFMATATDTIAAGAGGDPAVVDHLRADVVTLREGVSAAVTNLQQHVQVQREHLASLRSELHTMVESERGRTLDAVEQRIAEAQHALSGQSSALQEWQDRVSREVNAMYDTAATAEQRARTATADLQAEAQAALATLRAEIQQGVEQAREAAQAELATLHAELDRATFQTRAATQAETGAIRIDHERALRKLRRQSQTGQALSLLIAVIALTVGIGAFAIAYLHLH
jgi:hypothetical protein